MLQRVLDSPTGSRLRELIWPEPAPGESLSQLHDRRWLRLLWAFSAAIIITCVSTPYLPMADLPQHAAQVGMLKNFSHYADAYQINWYTPYLLGYGAAWSLSWLVGVNTAIRLLVGISLAGLALSTAVLLRQVRARSSWALLVVPGLFGFSFDWGFLNYLVAAPLMVLGLVYMLRLAPREHTKFAAGLALILIAHVLALTHIIVYALAGLLAALIFLSQGPRLYQRALRVGCFATPIPLTLWWLGRTRDLEPQVREAIHFDLSWSRLGYLGSDMVGLEAGAVYATLGWLVLLLPWFQGARFAKPVYRWVPLVLVLAIFLLGPTRAFGTHFIANRFTYFVMPFYLFAMTPRGDDERPTRLAPMAIAAAFTTMAFGFFARDCYRFALESSHYQAIRYAMQPGKTALYMPFMSMSAYSPAPAYLHFASYYTAEKLGDVDFNFAQFFPEMVRIKDPRSRPIGAGFSFAPGHFHWQRHRGDNYHYFIVRSAGDASGIILKHTQRHDLKLLARRQWWWLFEKQPITP